MKRPPLAIVLLGAMVLAVSPQPAHASTTAPAVAASGAPAPAPAKPARRPLTIDEQRDITRFPDGSQPERPAAPQVVVPFGRKPGPRPDTAANAAAQSAAAVPGKVNDQVARCKALAEPHRQAACVHAPVASDTVASPASASRQ